LGWIFRRSGLVVNRPQAEWLAAMGVFALLMVGIGLILWWML
jgi:hypothetical protein